MMELSSNPSARDYQALPKVELHRHLEGSIRVETLVEVGREHGLPSDITTLRPLVQIEDSEPNTFENFLSKFATLRQFYRSPRMIERITREAIEDAAADNIRYLELRFTPVALSKAERFPLDAVIDWVIEAAREGEARYGVITRLIASVNRHESPDMAEQVAWLAMERKDNGIVGLDLAGNEAEFPAEPFVAIFREAQQEGLGVTIHAGEWNGPANVIEAIERIGAQRIGHGVRLLEDPNAVALAREREVVFEVCPTSNFQSGVIQRLEEHPLPRMIAAGLKVTINTDDPSVSNITLGHEYQLINQQFGLSEQVLGESILTAARAAFLGEEEKTRLVQRLQQELAAALPGA